MILLRGGFHLLPIPFLGALNLLFTRSGEERGPTPLAFRDLGKRRGGTADAGRRDEAESSLHAAYQMGCVAQLMSMGGFDSGARGTCGCDRSGDHSVE